MCLCKSCCPVRAGTDFLSVALDAGVLKVIDVRRQQASGQRQKKDQQQGKGAGAGKQQQPAMTGALALKALLQPAAAVDVGVGAGLPAWD
jgi:hypothetical protein